MVTIMTTIQITEIMINMKSKVIKTTITVQLKIIAEMMITIIIKMITIIVMIIILVESKKNRM